MNVYKSYNSDKKTYSLKLTGLSKSQINLISYLFNRLSSNGVCYEYSNGFSLPYLSVHSLLPLTGSKGMFVLPYSSLREIACLFGNVDLPSRDVVCDRFGKPISRLRFF